MTTIYGIKNCDTMKKAFKWLDAHDIDYTFNDYKKVGLDKKILAGWVKQVGWETLVNHRGTTWRKLPEAERDGINQSKAIALMLNNLSLIKRPVLVIGGDIHVGFSEDNYKELF